MRSPPTQPIIVCIETVGGLSVGPFDFSAGHTRVDCTNHAGGYLILQVKNVLKCSIVSICPQMRSRGGIDQLARYSDAIAGFPNASFENVPNPQISRHLFDVDGFTFEREAGVAGDDEKLLVSGKGGYDFFDHSVGEVFLLRITAHVLEWQNGDGRLVGER